MRLICLWCAVVAALAQAQEDVYYAPQTFRNHENRGPVLFRPSYQTLGASPRIQNAIESYPRGLFAPARNDVSPQGSVAEPWRPVGGAQSWGGPIGQSQAQTPVLPRADPWRSPVLSKEQQAAILHHKQALTSDGNFRYEYSSDNGLAVGETIEPDGSRVGAYQYKDPTGQIVKLKYRAGKEGFQILEGSHLPKSPEPAAPPSQDSHYMQAYEQQRRQYELQQQHNQQRPEVSKWGGQEQNQEGNQKQSAANQHYSNWRPEGQEDDGQYRENEVENANRGPHNFGEGYAFAFQG